MNYIGIDEVGRGPIAGAVAVGSVCILGEYCRKVKKMFPVIKDSKKLSHKQRLEWLKRIDEAKEKGFLTYAISFVSSSVIDKLGIVFAINKAISGTLKSLRPRENTKFLLDGGLYLPKCYCNQQTIIKGDEKKIAIALASIVAKVARDLRMIKLAKKFPNYGFEKHKGYGTKAHYEALKKYGVTPHHRKTFL